MQLEQLRKPPVIIAAAGVIALGAVAYALITNRSGGDLSYAHAEQGQVIESVTTTGSVKAAQQIDLSFQTSGRIASVHYDVGAHVAAGATLASLSSADQIAQLEQAKATLAAAQAKLSALKAGATPQSVAASQTAVTNAEAGVTTAEQSIIQASEDAYVKADDAIHGKVDQLFTNPRGTSPTFNLQLSDSQAALSIQSDRIEIEGELTSWQSFEQSLSASSITANDQTAVSQTRTYINAIASYLDGVSNGLTHAIPTTAYPSATIQGYQSSISTARSNVSTSLSNLNTAVTALTNAQSALKAAEAQLSVTEEGATTNDIAAQEAQVEGAQAAVDYASAQVGKTAIFAPISGTISKNDAHVGSTASPGQMLISMISDSRFQMETYVSEADLGKLSVGQKASITLDAYPDTPLAAHVIAIDPAATISGGATSYKVTLQFDENDARIKDGMSGSVVVTTKAKESTLYVPSSAIIRNGPSTSVLKEVSDATVLMPVSVGISGDGKTEILSGLSAGDTIRAFGQQ